MQKTFMRILVLAVLLFLWDLLFWQEKPGVNFLIYALLLSGSIIFFRPSAFRNTRSLGLLLMTIIAGAMVVVNNSVLSVLALFAFFFTMLGHSLVPEVRSVWYAAATTVVNYIKMPFEAYAAISKRVLGEKKAAAFLRTTKLAIIPLLVTMVFYFIYKGANPRFDTMTADLFSSINELIFRLFERLFTARAFFMLFGLVVVAGVLFRFNPIEALRMEKRQREDLVPVPEKDNPGLPKLKLDNEHKGGIIMLVMVNLILVVVNLIDINWIWFGFEVEEGISLKDFVHEGTWLLILSIVLSMVILFYLFRSEQNFFKPNSWLHKLSYLWIAQNLILGISVFIRNYHYISFHGLAYKRIGVIVFLTLVLIGLATMFIKVRKKKTLFHLVRINAWAAAILLCLMTLVNWDVAIVKFNLGHNNPAEIDIDNYLSLSSKVLPVLYADLDKVERQMQKHMNNRVRWVEQLDPEVFRERLDAKKDRFLKSYQEDGWPSWNLADQNTYRGLLDQGRVPEELKKP